MKRRELLKQAVVFGGLACIPSSLMAAAKDFFPANEYGKIYFGDGFDVVEFDSRDQRLKKVFCDLRAHSFVRFPGSSEKILVLEKWRKKICVVDFAEQKLVQALSAWGTRYFYGHACFSKDGQSISTIQVDHSTGQSYLVLMDAVTLKTVDEIPLTLGGAHELTFLPNSSVMAIAATGWIPDRNRYGQFHRIGDSAILFFDIDQRKVIDKKELNDPYLSLAHLKVTSDGRVLAISDVMNPVLADKLSGRLYDVRLDSELIVWPFPENLPSKGELLSLEINEQKQLVAVTNPLGKRTYFFSLKDRSFLSSIQSDSKGFCWGNKGQNAFLMQSKDVLISRQANVHFPIVEIPNSGLGISSHMLFVPA